MSSPELKSIVQSLPDPVALEREWEIGAANPELFDKAEIGALAVVYPEKFEHRDPRSPAELLDA